MMKFAQGKQVKFEAMVSYSDSEAQETVLKTRPVNGSQKTTGRKADLGLRRRILELRRAGYSISMTATLARCSVSHVKHVTAMDRSV
jgi:hypothetical protein